MATTQAEKFIKIQSIQSGNFTETNNHVDFVIPQGTYDLKNSYVSFNVIPNVTPFDVNGTNGTLPYFLTHGGLPNLESVMNGVFVKNASLKSDMVGRLEDIRNTNIIHYNMWQVTNSLQDKLSYNTLSTCPLQSPGTIIQPQGLKLNKLGTDVSDLSQRFEIHIPISEFLQLGSMKAFNTAKMGDVRLNMEMDLGQVRVLTYMDDGSVIEDDIAFGGSYNRLMDNIGEDVNQITTLTTAQPLGLDVSNSPYYVGQAINVKATGTGNVPPADIDEFVVITGIEVVADNKLQLTLSASIGSTAANEGYEAVTISGVSAPPDYLDAPFLDTAELRLKKIPDVDMGELTYITVTNESDNGNRLNEYRNQYYLEPECVAFSMIHTNDNGVVQDVTDVDNWRIVLDNVDVAGNRDIVKLSSGLVPELTIKTLSNLGLPWKSVINEYPVTKLYYDSYISDVDIVKVAFIGSPTSQTQNRKVLDFSIASDESGIRSLELFKFVVRRVSL